MTCTLQKAGMKSDWLQCFGFLLPFILCKLLSILWTVQKSTCGCVNYSKHKHVTLEICVSGEQPKQIFYVTELILETIFSLVTADAEVIVKSSQWTRRSSCFLFLDLNFCKNIMKKTKCHLLHDNVVVLFFLYIFIPSQRVTGSSSPAASPWQRRCPGLYSATEEKWRCS